MRIATPYRVWTRLVILLLIVFPLAILLFVPGSSRAGATISWLWFCLLLGALIGWVVLAFMPNANAAAPPRQFAIGPRLLTPAEVPGAVFDVMEVQMAVNRGQVTIFQGPLRMTPDAAFEHLKQTLGDHATPLLEEDDRYGHVIMLLPRPMKRPIAARTGRSWVNWLLFILTLCTTTWAGAAYQGVDILQQPGRFAVGLPYSLGLLAILGIHELGHFFTARHHGMDVTPPFFIPVPFTLGTFGAFIQMRSPPEDRKTLFDVAVAGPLAGFLIAVPAMLIGLRYSAVVPLTAHLQNGAMEGLGGQPSILLAFLSQLALGDVLGHGYAIHLGPLAFAGWLGLLVTALNLLPIGQLDGGHMARAMFGNRVGTMISWIGMWSLLLLAIFVWRGLLLWAIIVFFIAGRGIPPLNDITPISRGRRALGWLAFAILIAIITPMPHVLWSRMMNCPYL